MPMRVAVPARGPVRIRCSRSAPMVAHPGPKGFYSRPCFWAALASGIVAALVAAGFHPVGLCVFLLLGALVCAARRWSPACLLFVAALAVGARATYLLHAAELPGVRTGMPLTLRGRVARVLGVSISDANRTRIVFQAEQRRELEGWRPERHCFGVTVPERVDPGDVLQLSGRVRLPRAARNPGGPDWRLYWLGEGVGAQLTLRPEGYERRGHVPGAFWTEWPSQLRKQILSVDRTTLSPRAAVIANSMLVGDTAPVDPVLADQVREAFRESGTIHLMVVSGFQMSFLLGIFLWLGWRFWCCRHVLWLLGLGCGCFYYLATRGDPAATRALVMGGVYVMGALLSREPDPDNCLGLAACVLLLVNPVVVADAGFQLSFAAIWGLFRLFPPLRLALGPNVDWGDPYHPPLTGGQQFRLEIVAVVAACIGVNLGVAPILSWQFQGSLWASLPANLVAIPVAAGLLPTAGAHVALVSSGLGSLAVPVGRLADALYGWVRFFAGFHSGEVFPMPWWGVLLFLGVLALPAWAKWQPRWTLSLVVILSSLLVISNRLPDRAPTAPTLEAIDVGQGDSILLRGTDGSNILVDAGPPEHPVYTRARGNRDAPAEGDPGRDIDPELAAAERSEGSAVARTLRALRIPRLDAIVVSHAHADHVGGLPDVLDALPVGEILHGLEHPEIAEWRHVVEAAQEHRVPLVHLRVGDQIAVRDSWLSCLGPAREPPPSSHRRPDLNRESLVLRWDAEGDSFLLPGDENASAERDLLHWGARLRCDVLKVPHHGSRTGSGSEFLQLVQPRAAVISCGEDNHFGHPAPETVERLQAAGIATYRTDREGMVTITDDHGKVRATTYLSQ